MPLSTSARPDSELDRIRAGDPAALTAWFERHVDPLYAFVFYRVGNDPDLAADTTQATFAHALERLGDYDPARGDMLTWLRLLSRNIIRRTLATQRKAAQLQTVWDTLDASLRRLYRGLDRDPLPDAALERAETRELVGMTLANLPSHYREVLEAKYLHDETLETIARARDATVDAVKSLLHRARAAFREIFLTLAESEVPR
jgi:RNA polymerase sigma-70 factor (ECF subfamily)